MKLVMTMIGLVGVTVQAEKDYKYLRPLDFFTDIGGGANTIKMCVQEMILVTKQDSEGALIECWDKDTGNDDKMCHGTTGPDGCVVMNYKKQAWDGPLGGSTPDIYCSANKRGFVQSVPNDKDHHDQSQQAVFKTTLYKDRTFDYGDVNGCGPKLTEGFGNDLAGFVLPFDEQCLHHGKCYSDCQILKGFENDPVKAQEFCDSEMFEGMKSTCYWRHGNLPGGGDSNCVRGATVVYEGLKLIGRYAYDIQETCPDDDLCMNPDLNADPNAAKCSMENDYSSSACSPNGHKCGYHGTTSSDTAACRYCCNTVVAKDEGFATDDWYCKCTPKGVFCRSTLITNSFNRCNECCSGQTRVEDGWLYDNFYCK